MVELCTGCHELKLCCVQGVARDRSLTAVLTAACSQDSYEVETATAGTLAEDGGGYIVGDDVISNEWLFSLNTGYSSHVVEKSWYNH